jgi:deferrochelatase/peroxidase EfeB
VSEPGERPPAPEERPEERLAASEGASGDRPGTTSGSAVRSGQGPGSRPARRSGSGVTRRGLLGASGLSALAGVAAGAGLATAAEARSRPHFGAPIGFHGAHQAGIATPVQDRLHFAAFDVVIEDRGRLIQMLKDWTVAAAAMCAGRAAGEGAVGGIPEAPPDDTGEALGLPPSRLTITIGFGPSLFESDGKDRFGLAGRRPEALADLPHFSGDVIDPDRSHGDIAIQACADDPQVAVHAVRNLARIGFGVVAMRWSQLGFGKTSSTTPDEQTPRNLMGFKDGTNNIPGTDTAQLSRFVWVGRDAGPDWLVGGSYLVARRIRMAIEPWDRTSLQEQEDIFGRDKREGASYGRKHERDPVMLDRMPPDAHVRLVNPASVGGIKILRRGYSFVDGTDRLGRLDAGLFFIAYQKDPRTGFIPLQKRLAARDELNEYIQHVNSGVYACPPGVREGSFWGESLFS